MIELQKDTTKRRAILAGLNTEQSPERYGAAMDELQKLAEACDLEVTSRVIQNAVLVTQKTLLGSGKVEELKMAILAEDADVVIFQETLTPMQVRNLEDVLDTEVLDRTGIILLIFSARARTREARLQVKMAQLQYMLPRLAGMRRNLSRQGGGSGRLSNKGAGEEKLELDRRHIEREIAEIRRQLREVKKERETQRNRRQRSGLALVSLVGYTNAGKSTVLNGMLSLDAQTMQREQRKEEQGENGKRVLEKDMLFATLDTAVRRIELPGYVPFLLSDTVGFISDLPHTLVEAFRSTLEEACFADLLVEVVDYSDPEYQEHLRVTRKTLEEIGAGHIPTLIVYNKTDRCENEPSCRSHQDHIYFSARDPAQYTLLLEKIEEALEGEKEHHSYLLPYDQGALLHEMQERYAPDQIKYLPEGVYMELTLAGRDARRLERYLQSES